ncbi:LysR family transcriptional regulator [Chromobacterium subtsugae]|uniref:LysR family transcriptional regulator n=1 Tax=Chromobacterium subtsugae TaxID=251747 RepID=UPI0007F901BC|nr:LysR substrate-binding domain-containing protein [Chromobacterium subtsugae]OBU86127.1 LysR family transcriptional regulator [Chromobacterium subtsugae]
MRTPSLKLLLGFEAAARHGNFSRAADELCLSQSAISHQVQQLEAQLGQPLFRRVGRGVELTVAGEVLQQSVRRALDNLQGGLGRIAGYMDPGLVVLVCPAGLAHGWLQPRLADLQRRLPQLSLLLSTDESARFIDEIDVDIVIADRPLQQAGVAERPWLRDEWVVAAAPELARRLEAAPIERHPELAGLLCLEDGFTDARAGGLFRGHLAGFRRAGVYDDARLLLDAALRGQGAACLPALLADEALADGRLRRLAGYPAAAGAQYWLARADGEPRAAIVAAVADWLLAKAGLAASV